MIWMHTTAAYAKFGTMLEITREIARGALSLDDCLPPTGEHTDCSASMKERIAQRHALHAATGGKPI